MNDLNIGDSVEVRYPKYLSKEEELRLKKLNFRVTVDDLDIVNNVIMGFYSKEFSGYLFTEEDLYVEISSL